MTESKTLNDLGSNAWLCRRPLAVGNVYRYKGYKGNGFKVTAMSLPGTPSDDGGLPGVAVTWLNHTKDHGWYPFASEAKFWEHMLFSNASIQKMHNACGEPGRTIPGKD